MKNALIIFAVLLVPALTFAVPDDPGFGVYIAPMIASGHFGIKAYNLPIASTISGSTSVSPSPFPQEADRRLSVGAKLGLFYRPDNYERRHRFDLEIQGDYFTGEFGYQQYTADTTATGSYSTGTLKLTGIGAVVRIRWSGEIQERWQPYVHFGYAVNMLTFGSANGLSHGTNVGAGMRVRLCNKYAFYFEYETSPMGRVELPLNEIDATLGANTNTDVALEPGYSQVTAAFEFPISFCISCDNRRR